MKCLNWLCKTVAGRPLSSTKEVSEPQALNIGSLEAVPTHSIDQVALSTSLIHVIAHPERYHGRRIKVIGFCCFRFEGKAIYLTEADYQHGVGKNGLWLSAPLSDENMRLHESYVLVEGTCDMYSQGHGSLFFGSIVELTRFQRWT